MEIPYGRKGPLKNDDWAPCAPAGISGRLAPSWKLFSDFELPDDSRFAT